MKLKFLKSLTCFYKTVSEKKIKEWNISISRTCLFSETEQKNLFQLFCMVMILLLKSVVHNQPFCNLCWKELQCRKQVSQLQSSFIAEGIGMI